MAIEVQTTQNVVIEYDPAGLGKRMLAYLIDWVVIIAWILGALGLWYLVADSSVGNLIRSSDFNILFVVLLVFPVVFYDLLFEYFYNGQSLGKKLLKIRVINIDGSKPSFGSLLMRWLFRLIDFFVTNFLVGVIMVAATKNSQRLGDMLAKTTFISMKMSDKNGLTLVDLNFHDNYRVTYPDVLHKLSDRDIQTILSIIDSTSMVGNTDVESRLVNKVKEVTGYTNTEASDLLFLRKIVNDYNYMALQD